MMKCTYCLFFTQECTCPDVSYEFLDDYDWNENILPKLCKHFSLTKSIIEVQKIDLDISAVVAEIHLKLGFVNMIVPIFESKFNNSYYCVLQGENKSRNGYTYYNVTFSSKNLTHDQSFTSISRIKKSLVDIFLYRIGKASFDEVFDDEYNINLPHFILSADEIFSQFNRDKKIS
ncbi:MAG: hypothetical protein ACOCRK_06160 [bacterium]